MTQRAEKAVLAGVRQKPIASHLIDLITAGTIMEKAISVGTSRSNFRVGLVCRCRVEPASRNAKLQPRLGKNWAGPGSLLSESAELFLCSASK